MAVSSSLSGDVSFRKVLSFVRTHREAILERFEPAGFCLALVEDGDHPEFVAEARARRLARARCAGLCDLERLRTNDRRRGAQGALSLFHATRACCRDFSRHC